MGAIAGTVSAEAKLELVRAVGQAQRKGMALRKACEIIELPRARYYQWLGGREPDDLTLADFSRCQAESKPSVQRITEVEREAIVEAAKDEAKVDLHHRKLAHTLGREGIAYVSESTVFRVLKAEGLVSPRRVRRRLVAEHPELMASGPRQVWCWDFSYLKIGLVFWYILAIIDQYSRKIVGCDLVCQATAEEAKRVWDEALAAEGLLDTEPMALGRDGTLGGLDLKAMSDNGPQMKARTMREFFRDLGVMQVFSRPHTPEDNAYIETWFATAKCEKIYRDLTECDHPLEAREVIKEFVRYYNEERLHQGIGFVTPAERHEGRDVALLAARRAGLEEARRNRLLVNRLAGALSKREFEVSNSRKEEGSLDRLVQVFN